MSSTRGDSFSTLSASNWTVDASSSPAALDENMTHQRGGYNQTELVLPTFLQLEVAHALFLYISPVLIICGSIGNILSFIVLQSILFRKLPCSFLLSALAVVDTGVLLTGLLRHWIRVLTDNRIDLRYLSEAACKSHVYLTYLFPILSSWTLVLLSIERSISIAIPIQAKVICSHKRTIIAWVFTMLFMVALNLHFPFIFTMTKAYNSVKPFCYVKEEFKHFFSHIWVWVDFAFVAMIPVVVIFTCNVLIIIKMCQANHNRTQTTSSDGKAQVRSIRSTTVMLVIVNLVFLVTNLPWGIFFLGRPYWPEDSWNEKATLELVYAVFSLNSYVNNAVNFLLYCISGSRFREAMFSVLCRRKSTNAGRASVVTANRTRSTHENNMRRLSSDTTMSTLSSLSLADHVHKGNNKLTTDSLYDTPVFTKL